MPQGTVPQRVGRLDPIDSRHSETPQISDPATRRRPEIHMITCAHLPRLLRVGGTVLITISDDNG
ncbi:hypothetical protein ACPPVO_24125 [Dactylosporangium sp. McL0621]|uniref:hypothetical protein n=1 Tax=Dactylosporangium sp. McL0621 TaxID=3415678 RepID=UPI003CFBC00D